MLIYIPYFILILIILYLFPKRKTWSIYTEVSVATKPDPEDVLKQQQQIEELIRKSDITERFGESLISGKYENERDQYYRSNELLPYELQPEEDGYYTFTKDKIGMHEKN